MYGRFVASIAILVLVLGIGGPEASAATLSRWAPAEVQAKVVDVVTVVDAGTIDVRDAGAVYRVHAIGIDVPLVTGGGECWSSESVEFARRMLEGKQVGLEVDPSQVATDQWNRAMRYIMLPDDRNYSIVAAEEGVAWTFIAGTIPGQFHVEIGAAEQKARAGGVGLWGPPCNGQHHTSQPPPPKPQGQPGGDPRPANRGGQGAAPAGILLIEGDNIGLDVAVQPWWRDYAAAAMSGVRAGGSHAPVVNRRVIASRVSRPHLVAVDR